MDILSATKDLVHAEDYVHDHSKGFNIAAAFTDYNSNEEWELPAKYGSLLLKSFSWGLDENGVPVTKRVTHPSHVCSDEELNIDGSYAVDPEG